MKEYVFNGFRINEPKNERNKNKNKKKKKLNKKKIVISIIIILLLIIIVTMCTLYERNRNFRDFFDKYIFRKEVFENNLPKIEVNVGSSNIYAFNNKMAILNQNKLSIYNKHGVEEYSFDAQITLPIFASNGEYLCVAEKNGQKIYVFSGKNLIWQNNIEGNISNIHINSKGYVAVAISGTSYKTVVKIFDSSGKELFNTYHSTTYVIDAEISDDCKNLAIAEIDFSGIIVQSTIKIISIEKATQNSPDSITFSHIAEANSLIIDLKYNKNALICRYDNCIDMIKDNTNTRIIDLNNEEILFSDLNDDIIKIVKQKDGAFNSNIKLQIVSSNDQSVKEYEIDEEPKAIYVCKDVIAINLGTEVIFINNNTWLIKKYQSSQEINNVVLGSDIAGIVYNNLVEIVSL